MTAVHREGLKAGAIAGAIVTAIGIATMLISLGIYAEKKADKADVNLNRERLIALERDNAAMLRSLERVETKLDKALESLHHRPGGG